MPELMLYHLHLQKPLFYSADVSVEMDRISIFEENGLVVNDEAQGPRLVRPLPAPLFSGGSVVVPPQPADQMNPASLETLSQTSGTILESRHGHYILLAKDYVFCQWSQDDFSSIEEGLESFVRQVWWEQRTCVGPWILRAIQEEKGLVFQGMRAMKEQGS